MQCLLPSVVLKGQQTALRKAAPLLGRAIPTSGSGSSSHTYCHFIRHHSIMTAASAAVFNGAVFMSSRAMHTSSSSSFSFSSTSSSSSSVKNPVSAVAPSKTFALFSSGSGFLRSVRFSSPAAATAGSLRFTPFCIPHRCMSVRGKGADSAEDSTKNESGEPSEKETKSERAEDEEGKAKAEEEGKAEEDGKTGKKGKKQQPKKKNSFADHIRGLKEDYVKFPDIYNSANAINFVIFTVFCLCSTGSNTEEKWWMDQWGLDNSFHPWTWFLHSFLTNNFLSMSYAMMLLHPMCHALMPTMGSHGLMAFVGATAVVSGAIMWLGNRLYYGSEPAPEKQFGPWDVVHALFVMYYLQLGVTPVAFLNSYNSWLKYAVWVGEVCILYFDWQPTLVGTVVGLALCKSVPRFRVKPVA